MEIQRLTAAFIVMAVPIVPKPVTGIFYRCMTCQERFEIARESNTMMLNMRRDKQMFVAVCHRCFTLMRRSAPRVMGEPMSARAASAFLGYEEPA